MASTAVSKYRTAVKVSTATSATKTITAITKATAAVVTSSTHGLAVGQVVVFSAVAGMTEINGMAGVITAQDTNTFTLGGIDSTNFTTYTSGGIATPHTMTLVANADEFEINTDEADQYDSTNMQSIKKEYVLGLSGEGPCTIGLKGIDPTDPGQERVRKLVGVDSATPVTVTRSDLKTMACMVKFKGNPQSFPDLHTGSFSGVVTGAVAWYA